MMYVLTVDSNQAIAQTKDEAIELLMAKFKEHLLNGPMSDKKENTCDGNVKRIYFSGEVATHAGNTGWTKKTR